MQLEGLSDEGSNDTCQGLQSTPDGRDGARRHCSATPKRRLFERRECTHFCSADPASTQCQIEPALKVITYASRVQIGRTSADIVLASIDQAAADAHHLWLMSGGVMEVLQKLNVEDLQE